MRAVVVEHYGGPEVLVAVDRPEPEPREGWIVVRVRAANVNPTDLAARQGFIIGGPLDPPLLLGWDFAGEVHTSAPGCDLAVGDRVVGMIPWYAAKGITGTYAELTEIDPEWAVPLPDGLDEVVAATIPLNALTAAQALDLLELGPASRLLITGASGSVGSFAAQIATAAGHQVTALVGRGDDGFVESLGVAAVLSRDSDLGALEPFDYVLDGVPLGEAALGAVADGGSIVSTRPIPEADASRRIRQQFVLIKADRPRLAGLVEDVAAGRLKTRVDRTIALEDAAEAHRLVEAGGLRGKVVLVT